MLSLTWYRLFLYPTLQLVFRLLKARILAFSVCTIAYYQTKVVFVLKFDLNQLTQKKLCYDIYNVHHNITSQS